MATIDQLYTRIILDTSRDDLGSGGELEQAKIDAVADAVETWADELFWFNGKSGTAATVASTATVVLPTGMRVATIVSYLGTPLLKVTLASIQEAYNATTPVTGVPTRWANDGSAIRLYPTPDAAYTLSVYGVADLGVPTTGNSNAWTTEGRDLILNEAKAALCRGPLRDSDGLTLAKDGREEALAHLRRETRKRGVAALFTDLPVPAAFNIVTG